MFIGEIARTGEYITSLSNVQPFIYRGYTKYYSLKKEWGTSINDLFDTTFSVKTIQVTENYLNKYLKVNTYNDMATEEGSWYYDAAHNCIYIHVIHTTSPITSYYDYCLAFGVTTNGVIYIDDFAYLPIVKSYPQIEVEADYVGQSAPTGIVGSVTLSNMEYQSETGTDGMLDFLLTETIAGNDFIMYDYTDNVLTETEKMNIENVNISLQDVKIDLQDMRMK